MSLAPDFAILCAMAKPIPLAPPVTMAVRPFRSMMFMCTAPAKPALLKLDAVGALKAEHLPRLGGRGDLEAEILDDAADFRHLLGVTLGELAGSDVERILQPHAHVASDHRRRGA